MLASIVGPLILVFLAVIMALLVLAAVGSYFLYRAARRRYRTVRDHAIVQTITTTATALDARWGGGRQVFSGGRSRPGAWNPSRTRRQMWYSVNAADEAVSVAREANASIGDLSQLCGNLKMVAAQLDAVLRAQSAGGRAKKVDAKGEHGAQQLLLQVDEVRRAASDIQTAAINAATDAHSPKVQALLHDAATELQCVRAGLDAVHRIRS